MWQDLDRSSRLKTGYAVIFLLAVSLAWSALAAQTALLERKRVNREAVLKELLPLKVSYQKAKVSADRMMGRMSTVRSEDSPAKLIEEIGIRGKGVKTVPVKSESRDGFIEEAADVRIEGITANEAINLMYRLEKGGRPVLLKKTNLRVRFDDPSRLDMTMTVALLKQAAGPMK
jgi:general secretion pathway protein M